MYGGLLFWDARASNVRRIHMSMQFDVNAREAGGYSHFVEATGYKATRWAAQWAPR